MSSVVNASKKSSSEKINNIEHVLNPKKFIRLFTKETCTYEEKLIQKILQHICALRNSGGGKLTIWLTETCSTREIEACAEIIINAAENVLSDTKRNDFKKSKCMNRLLMFFIKGSEEIVTMNYNMYIMENNDAKLVPSTKPAAEVRLFLQRQKGEAVPGKEECYFHPKDDEKIIERQTRQKSQSLKDRNVRQKIFERQREHTDKQDPKTLTQKEKQNPKRQKEEPCLRPKECVRANIAKDQTRPTAEPCSRVEKRVYRNIAKDQTKRKELVARAEENFHKTTRFLPLFDDSLLQTTPLYAKKLVIKGQKIKPPTVLTINYKMLPGYTFHKYIAGYISLAVHELIKNYQVGELYGIAFDGAVHREKFGEIEVCDIQRKVEKMTKSMVWPRHVDSKVSILPVGHQEDSDLRYVIRVSPWNYHVCRKDFTGQTRQNDEQGQIRQNDEQGLTTQKEKQDRTGTKEGPCIIPEECVYVNDQIRLKVKEEPLEEHNCKTTSGFHPSSKNPLLPVILLQTKKPKTKLNAKLLNQEEIVKGEKIKRRSTAVTVKFKMLKEKKFYSPQKSVADCITQDEYDLRQYVSAFANHQGGELYYGIASDGTIHGERMKEIEIDDIQRIVEKKIESMVWPRHVDNIQKFWTICFLPVKHEEDADPRYVIKISVDRCPGGVFVTDPESYYVVRNSVVKLAYSMWIARLEGSSTAEMLDKTDYREFTGKTNYINLNQINIHSPGGATN